MFKIVTILYLKAKNIFIIYELYTFIESRTRILLHLFQELVADNFHNKFIRLVPILHYEVYYILLKIYLIFDIFYIPIFIF